MRTLPLWWSIGLLVGCGASDDREHAVAAPPPVIHETPRDMPQAVPAGTAADDTAHDDTPAIPDFPLIPTIVVPDILGVTPAQRALEASMKDAIDPVAGISVAPARCGTDGTLVNDGGITSVDAQGNVLRNGKDGLFNIGADGTGTANFEGGVVSVNADGSGTINGSVGGGADAIVQIHADGSGTYNGPAGIISLDGKGAGTWNGKGGFIENHGDGSGFWNGPEGLVTINADGSGTWNGPHGLLRNNGDGTGQIGTPPRRVAMAPLSRVAPAGRFPPMKRFAPPGAPCGYLITLSDRVLFDFDKSAIRPDAARILDALAGALSRVQARDMEIRGHTDSKGSDDYNQQLSERRAVSVREALVQRGLSIEATAKGYGESKPVAPNELNGKDNPAGRQANRRVEVFVRT